MTEDFCASQSASPSQPQSPFAEGASMSASDRAGIPKSASGKITKKGLCIVLYTIGLFS